MAMQGLLLAAICHVTLLVVVLSHPGHNEGSKDDPHGGVPMGIPNSFCDDGKSYLSIDWDPSSTDEYTCTEDRKDTLGDNEASLSNSFEECEQIAKRPVHVCYPEKIHYDEDLPTSGRHRPLWPKYGEYKYLPPERWLHSLEHGAIVFLYNPCADERQVEEFKALARGCLRRHVISPSKRIPRPNTFAVLAWTCKLVMTHLDVPRIVNFVRTHALHSPEYTVYGDGQYSEALTHHAKLVSTLDEKELCPEMSLMAETADLVSKMSTNRRNRLIELRKVMEKRALNSELARYFNLSKRR